MGTKTGWLVAVLLLAGCTGELRPVGPNGATAPLPYTDRQVLEACRPGHTVVYRVDEQGSPATSLTLRVVGSSADSIDVETIVADQQGAPLGPPRLQHPRWGDVHQPPPFPRDTTSIAQQKITTPAGTFDTAVYTVRRDAGVVERFYFAKALPGPPLLYLSERDGVTMRTSTVVSISDRR